LDEIRRRDELIREQEERTRTLEDQNKRLQDELEKKLRELEEQRRQIEEQEKIIEDLREELRVARFGPRSEKRSKPKETTVSSPGEADEEGQKSIPQVPKYVSEHAEALPKLNKEKGKRRASAKKSKKEVLGKVPPHIPTRSTYTILPTVGNLCPYCHESLGVPLKQEESTKLCKCLYRVERIVMYRVSSLCRACGTFFYSSTPEDPFPKSGFDASVVADVAVEKFVDGVPLHRQAQAFRRDGILVSEDTLEELILKGAALLGHTYEYLLEEVKDSPIVASDQTRLRVRVPGEEGVSRYVQGSLSLSVNLQGDVALVAAADQKKESCEAAIGDRVEILVTDAAAIFSSIAQEKGLKEANCFSHARRKFFQALQSDPVLADGALDFFAALYAVEAAADLRKATPEERKALRQEYSRPVLVDFRKWCEEVVEIREKDEKLRKAVDYMLCRWEKFEIYLHDGRIPIGRVKSRRGRSYRAPFPTPARRTGRAVLPHPALIETNKLSRSNGRHETAVAYRGQVLRRDTCPGIGDIQCPATDVFASTIA